MDPNFSTVLVIVPTGMPPYAARGLKQTLSPIDTITGGASQNAFIRRDVNGMLTSLLPAFLQKYKSVITCDDIDAPSLDGIFPGTEITIQCVAELAYPYGNTAQRPVVANSARDEGNGFIFYRPFLTMLVTAFESTSAEWDAKVSWRLESEEV